MTKWTDKHYDFTYELTEEDISKGSLKIDPYFVAKQWKTGSKDDSGALFHVLKTVARFGDKNDVEREVKALYAQVLGVARSFGVELQLPEEEFSSKGKVSARIIDSNTGNTISEWVNGKWANRV